MSVNLGGDMAEFASEREVNGADRDAWYYDASAHRLIVKVMPE